MKLLENIINFEGINGLTNDGLISLRLIEQLGESLALFFSDWELFGWEYTALEPIGFFKLQDEYFMIYCEPGPNEELLVDSVSVGKGSQISIDSINVSFTKSFNNEELFNYLEQLRELGFKVPDKIEINEDYLINLGEINYSLSIYSIINPFMGLINDFSNLELIIPANNRFEDYYPEYFI